LARLPGRTGIAANRIAAVGKPAVSARLTHNHGLPRSLQAVVTDCEPAPTARLLRSTRCSETS